MLWFRQYLGKRLRPAHVKRGEDQGLRSLFGGNPRPSGIPSTTEVQAGLDPPLVGLLHGKTEQVAPFLTHKRDGFGRRPAAGVEDQNSRDALALHLVEILDDAIARDVAVQPPPINPRLGPVRWSAERLGQSVRPGFLLRSLCPYCRQYQGGLSGAFQKLSPRDGGNNAGLRGMVHDSILIPRVTTGVRPRL